jgi:hypothetical protein
VTFIAPSERRNRIDSRRGSLPNAWFSAPRCRRDRLVDALAEGSGHLPNKPTDSTSGKSAEQQERAFEKRGPVLNWDRLLFKELFWPVERVIAWVAFRDPMRLEIRPATFYEATFWNAIDQAPTQTLSQALRDGRLRALKGGEAFPHEQVDPPWPGDIYFKTEDVLALWPPKPDGWSSHPAGVVATTMLPGTNLARKARRGPAPGTVDRFGECDLALFPEIERIMREKRKTLHGATLELALAGKIQGIGADPSRAKRLARRYQKERGQTATR